ncbi:MAG: hypothetical protein K2R98_12330 [Gemmataceae bacterium]|nr:hypothetical protein [Gemmataceae bacterium]
MLNIVLGGLVFLFPVACYFLFLAMINGRQHPTMIYGPWDFAGVLLATSGFLLVAGPIVLGAFHSRVRAALTQGQLPAIRDLGGNAWGFWVLLWGSYFLVILLGGFLLMRQRRNSTVIYNIERITLDEALGQVFSRLHLDCARVANRFFLSQAPADASEKRSPVASSDAIQSYPDRNPIASADERTEVGDISEAMLATRPGFELEVFPTMQNVTLRWRGTPETLRGDVEAELDKELRETVTPDNPAASWFLTVASCLFLTLFLGLLSFIVYLTRGR